MTSEKQLPFEQNTRKEEKFRAQNIEGNSDDKGLHARTNSIENDKESTTLSKEEQWGTRSKTKSKKGFPRV